MCQPRNPQPPTTRAEPRVIVGRFSDILADVESRVGLLRLKGGYVVKKRERLTGGDEFTGLEFDEWGIVRGQAWFYGTL